MLTATTLTSMAQEVDTVNMLIPTPPHPYHHGQLRDSLVDAGLQLARAQGPEAVRLRAASRVAGVSHNAAYRHFTDRDELLRTVCERSMSKLAVLIEKRIDEVSEADAVTAAWARLRAVGAAYVEFAITEPGWFRTAFAVPGTTRSRALGAAVGGSGLSAHELLGVSLDALVKVGAISAHRVPGLEWAAWSAVHGLAALLNAGPLRGLPTAERDLAVRAVLDFIGRAR
jgi:AcrR family transcriptional regulator